jgi:hypothetical protein
LIALLALYIGFKALRISERVEKDAKLERQRAEQHDRLIWMQTILNHVDPLAALRAAEDERAYVEKQRWMQTCLARGGLRDDLPITKALTEREFAEPWEGMIELRDEAREELFRKLDHVSDRVYAGEKLT